MSWSLLKDSFRFLTDDFDDWKFFEDLSDEGVFFIELPRSWQMFFDGAARCNGVGAGVVFFSPEGEVMPFAFNLKELCSNNAAEYQALIFGLEMAII